MGLNHATDGVAVRPKGFRWLHRLSHSKQCPFYPKTPQVTSGAENSKGGCRTCWPFASQRIMFDHALILVQSSLKVLMAAVQQSHATHG